MDVEGPVRVCKAMRTFPEVAQVQAGGSWALAALAAKDGNLRQQAEEAGGLELCADAAAYHREDATILRNTRLAIRRIRNLDASGDDDEDGDPGERCVVS